jgi:hypothetical protein
MIIQRFRKRERIEALRQVIGCSYVLPPFFLPYQIPASSHEFTPTTKRIYFRNRPATEYSLIAGIVSLCKNPGKKETGGSGIASLTILPFREQDLMAEMISVRKNGKTPVPAGFFSRPASPGGGTP